MGKTGQMNLKEINIHVLESKSETSVSKAYKSGREHLTDELLKLDALVHLQVLRLRDSHSKKRFDELAGLYITEEEVDKVLGKEPKSQDRSSSSTKKLEIEALLNHTERLRAKISKRVENSLNARIHLPLHQLSHLFHLTPFELDILLTCLAPELNLKYEKLYAYLLMEFIICNKTNFYP